MNNHQSKYAYKILREHPGCDHIFYGIDFFECSRYYLWDVIGRAIRKQRGEDEYEIKYPPSPKLDIESIHQPIQPQGVINIQKPIARSFSTFRKKIAFHVKRDRKKVIWIPVLSSRLSSIEKEIEKKSRFELVIGGLDWGFYQSSDPSALAEQERLFVNTFFQESVRVLEKHIQLPDHDKILFKENLVSLATMIREVQKKFNKVKPDLILTHTDNHPPYIVYCLSAKAVRVPVIMIQHGLDCEHYILEEAYADHIAVWGASRKMRYSRNSTFRPNIMITGNPAYDSIKVSPNIHFDGKVNWLWLMRPHSSEKCYSPARSPNEGIKILNNLLKAKEQFSNIHLLLKPHPFTNRKIYEDQIEVGDQNKYQTRLVDDEDTMELIRKCDLVISEDSTTLLDACLVGKPIIHVNYSGESPTVNAEDLNACWMAYNFDTLLSALREFMSTDAETVNKKFNSGRLKFISLYAYSLDGKATSRVMNYMNSILGLRLLFRNIISK